MVEFDECGVMISNGNETYEIHYNDKVSLKTQLILDRVISKCRLMRGLK